MSTMYAKGGAFGSGVHAAFPGRLRSQDEGALAGEGHDGDEVVDGRAHEHLEHLELIVRISGSGTVLL